ncbi:hypothetical protein BDR03DRAFT_961384 [Suillus americanus]|nr:hypothetical protein BDR03DRAFT_961384 [Suillus americanus]
MYSSTSERLEKVKTFSICKKHCLQTQEETSMSPTKTGIHCKHEVVRFLHQRVLESRAPYGVLQRSVGLIVYEWQGS